MDTLDLEIDYYKNQLTELVLPATLMDCFEVFRRAALRKAAQTFNEKELSWLLLTMNEFRGADDRKEGFDLLFDPLMYTVDHPAWSAPPGTVIELPVLNSGLYERAGRGTRFRAIADSELTALSVLTDGYPDEGGHRARGDGSRGIGGFWGENSKSQERDFLSRAQRQRPD